MGLAYGHTAANPRQEASHGVGQQSVYMGPFHPAKNAGLGDGMVDSKLVLAHWVPIR